MQRLIIQRPGRVLAGVFLLSLLPALLLLRLHIKADPLALLPAGDPVRAFHERTFRQFSLFDGVTVTVFNDSHPQGVFNPGSLERIDRLARFGGRWTGTAGSAGCAVVEAERATLDAVLGIASDGLGRLRFEPLMATPPQDEAAALLLRDRIQADPLLSNAMLTGEGKGLTLFFPLNEYSCASLLFQALDEAVAGLGPEEERYQAEGLVLAMDTLNHELPSRLAVMLLAPAPAFFLLLFFFRSFPLSLAPAGAAVLSALWAMGLRIATGFPLQMADLVLPLSIPPFSLIISLLLLTAFTERYGAVRDTGKVLAQILPLVAATTLTLALASAGALLCLALVPVPPLRLLALTGAGSVMLAWLLTMVLVSAALGLQREERLRIFLPSAVVVSAAEQSRTQAWGSRVAALLAGKPWLPLIVLLVLLLPGAAGLMLVRLDDNPLRWRADSLSLVRSEKSMAEDFSGGGSLYLILSGQEQEMDNFSAARWLQAELAGRLDGREKLLAKIHGQINVVAERSTSGAILADELALLWSRELGRLRAEDSLGFDTWSLALDALEGLRGRERIFLRPDVLHYLLNLQSFLSEQAEVGSAVSLASQVRLAHRALFEDDPAHYAIPESANGVAQVLEWYKKTAGFQSITHLVGKDYGQIAVHVQLQQSGRKDVARLMQVTGQYLVTHPPPVPLQHDWAGISRINSAWQDLFGRTAPLSLLLAFFVVLLLLTVSLHSAVLAGLTLMPLVAVLIVVYGLSSLTGREWSLPLAMLPFVLPGLALPASLHLIASGRKEMIGCGDWQVARLALVTESFPFVIRSWMLVAAAEVPLLAVSLAPYRSFALWLLSVLFVSNVTAALILPLLFGTGERWLFTGERKQTAAKGSSGNGENQTMEGDVRPAPAGVTEADGAIQGLEGEAERGAAKGSGPSIFEELS